MKSTHSELRDEHAALQAVVLADKQRLAQHEQQLDVLQAQLNKIVYPILALPLEITTTIFSLCGPQLIRGYYVHYLDVKSGPRRFMQVCRRWRQIALSTPTLWATVYVDLEKPLLEDQFLVHLERSAGIPLNLGICGYPAANPAHDPEGDDEEPGYLPLKHLRPHMEMLPRYSARVRTLEFRMSAASFVEVDDEFLGNSVLEFPILQRLQLPHPSLYDVTTPYNMFARSPRLTHLVGVCGNPQQLTLAWDKLETFEMSTGIGGIPGLGVYQCIELLKAMPNLRKAFLRCTSSEVDAGTMHTHPMLEDLSVHICDPVHILDFLVAPALRKLKVTRWQSKDTVLAINAFVKRSSPPLESLSTIITNPIPSEDLIELFKLTPALTSLEIRQPSRASIDALGTAFAARPALLPKLRRLSLLDIRTIDDGKEPRRKWPLKDLVASIVSALSKRDTPVSLEQLVVSAPSGILMRASFWRTTRKANEPDSSIYDDDKRALRAFRAQGMYVDLSHEIESKLVRVQI
ncbi:F-box domain-containing protein [Mycena kentingensis (nom. inval.)]|nr:F-box domain-containing protein [Mycena kentingensis (nom. inval.)]